MKIFEASARLVASALDFKLVCYVLFLKICSVHMGRYPSVFIDFFLFYLQCTVGIVSKDFVS